RPIAGPIVGSATFDVKRAPVVTGTRYDSRRRGSDGVGAIRIRRLDVQLRTYAIGAVAHVLKHVDADGRGEVGIRPLAVDAPQQARHRDLLGGGDGPDFGPERFFETHAGLVTADHDRTLGHGGFGIVLHRMRSPCDATGLQVPAQAQRVRRALVPKKLPLVMPLYKRPFSDGFWREQ